MWACIGWCRNLAYDGDMQHPQRGRSLDGMSGKRPPHHANQPSQSPNGPQAPSSEAAQQPPSLHEEITNTDLRLDDTNSPDTSSRKRHRWLTWQKLVLAGSVLLAGAVIVAGLAYWYVQSSLVVDNVGGGAALLQEDTDPDMLQGEGDGRINTLLMGVDNEGGLSDTIILASFDPIAKDVVMISIPRDLYVRIDGFGSAKINAAHAYGERYGYEGGGPELLKDTVSRVLDVPVHYYGKANFDGFKQAVDVVGGVTIDVEQTLHDPYYPDEEREGHDPLHIEAGTQHMDGETALRYTRSRKTTSDFDRSRRQQKVLMALRQKVSSRGTLTNPSKVTGLLGTLGENTETNMSVREIMRLVELGKGVDEDDVTRAQLDTSQDNFLTFSNIHGQSALVPTAGDFSQIQKHVRTLLVDSYIKDEGATVSVLNGTTRVGLAKETSELLRSYGYDVANIGNADNQNFRQTVIFDYSGEDPYTLRYLEQRFGVKAQRRQQPGQETPYDIEIVIGDDYDPSAE